MTPIGTEGADALTSAPLPKGRVHFCSRCGAFPTGRDRRRPGPDVERVCGVCGMGVMLGSPRGALTHPGAAFVVVTDDLRVSAVSQPAEALFGAEPEVIGSTLLGLISSPLGDDELATRVALAANGGREVVELPVRIQASRGPESFRARIAPCGPPRGALVTVAPA